MLEAILKFAGEGEIVGENCLGVLLALEGKMAENNVPSYVTAFFTASPLI
jgi:hypothetical protein